MEKVRIGPANSQADVVHIDPADKAISVITSGAVKFQVDGTGVGFFAKTPVAQQATIADAAVGTEIATINAILAVLEAYGLTASS